MKARIINRREYLGTPSLTYHGIILSINSKMDSFVSIIFTVNDFDEIKRSVYFRCCSTCRKFEQMEMVIIIDFFYFLITLQSTMVFVIRVYNYYNDSMMKIGLERNIKSVRKIKVKLSGTL